MLKPEQLQHRLPRSLKQCNCWLPQPCPLGWVSALAHALITPCAKPFQQAKPAKKQFTSASVQFSKKHIPKRVYSAEPPWTCSMITRSVHEGTSLGQAVMNKSQKTWDLCTRGERAETFTVLSYRMCPLMTGQLPCCKMFQDL